MTGSKAIKIYAFLDPPFFLKPTFFGTHHFVGQKFCWIQKISGPKVFLNQHFLKQKCFGPTFFGTNNFRDQHFFGVKIYLGKQLI